MKLESRKNRNRAENSDRGSALAVALFVILAIGIIIAGYLKITSTELKRSEDALLTNALTNLSEAGAEEAVWALNHEDWSEWVIVTGDRMIRLIGGIDLGKGRKGSARVIIEDYDTEKPIIYVEAFIYTSDGRKLSKQLKIRATIRGLFANGMTGEDKIVFDEAGASEVATFDGYNSANGPFDSFLNRTDSGTVGSYRVSISNADIYGYVATNEEPPSVGPDGKILRETSDADENIDPDCLTSDFVANFPDKAAPSLSKFALNSLPESEDGEIYIGAEDSIEPHEYLLKELFIAADEVLVVQGPVVMVVTGDVEIDGIIEIEETGSLVLYVGKDYTMAGFSHVNLTGDPINFLIFGTHTKDGKTDFKIDTGASIASAIYAPNAVITFIGAGATKFKDKDKDAPDKDAPDKDAPDKDKVGKKGKVVLCHVPPGNPGNAHTLRVSESALKGHLDNNGKLHGLDYLGVCEEEGPGELFGAVLGYQIFVYGTYFFHYDEQLRDTGGDTYTLLGWYELIKAGDKIDFSKYFDLIDNI